MDAGVKGDGHVAWVKLNTIIGVVGVACVYAPQSETSRADLWCWLARLVNEGNWVLAGDLNMVEKVEDSNCASPLLRGAELLSWLDLCQEADLRDCYEEAAHKQGSRFTRIQLKGSEVEMSRLDRAYLTCSGEWAHAVTSIKHDSKAGVSDHAPVIVDIALQNQGYTQGHHKTYMKLSVEDFKEKETRSKAIAAWRNKPTHVSDPRINWDLAWRRIKSVVKAARKEKRSREASREELAKLMAEWKYKVEQVNSQENRDCLKIALSLLKDKDEQEASLWRARSRAKWLQAGDAPTKYFFTLWQAKTKQDEIRVLKLEDGTVIEEKSRILAEVGKFYKTLYQEEGDTQATIEARREILLGIDKKVSVEENQMLERPPLEEELEECVRNLAKDKAPGLDGVSADVLREFWEEVKPMCMHLLSIFWEDERLTASEKKGVIKLILKNDERSMLTNRRPITLLGITYKIVSRILADRIKPILPGLVSGQQTGFVPGRSIFDNILTLKLGEEWAVESEQEAVFLKLDFIKAYDRVRHTFLWETLEAMGFSAKFIRLIQGLMVGAEATVHQNGDFTECFELERGVRQGCPLPPFLFSLSTEPLMVMLKQAAANGQVERIKLSGDRTLLHSLFADDTGLCLKASEQNFYAARRLVERFELISGTSLNVAKSLIVPLGMNSIPGWLFQTGCRVASDGEVWTYLGAPMGVNVAEEQLEVFLLEKLTKKINHWSNRLLSWEGRCIVLKHALSVLPNYYMMTLGLTMEEYKKMERVCWKFLWGRNKEGNDKKVMISWERICKDKQEGGLGICAFRQQAVVLKLRLISRILEGEDTEWITMAKDLLEQDFRSKKVNLGRSNTAEIILLLENTGRISKSRILDHILQGWKVGQKKLCFDLGDTVISQDIPISTIIRLGEVYTRRNGREWTVLKRRLRTMRVMQLRDLHGVTRDRLIASERLGYLPDGAAGGSGPVSEAMEFLIRCSDQMSSGGYALNRPGLWRWDPDKNRSDTRQPSWDRSNREWKVTLSPASNMRAKLNVSWGLNWDTERWAEVWKRLWKASLFPRDKLWIWKILNKGFFTAERGAAMGVMEPSCGRCENGTENIEHLFRQCQTVDNTWQDIATLLHQATGQSAENSSLNAETMARSLQAKNKRLDEQGETTNYAGSISLMRAVHQRNRLRRTRRNQREISTDTSEEPRAMETVRALDWSRRASSSSQRTGSDGSGARVARRRRSANSVVSTMTRISLEDDLSSHSWRGRDTIRELAFLGFREISVGIEPDLEGVG
ncbi:hypothetical protein R1sor_005669 [Riccia sorocarpa]|uniref:Reverse transcriptase domain-containing protein n=1 Tax=Riccia sorocarpa TaxID=122646 RepID=A0ABD3HKS1_9MARC